MFGTVLFLLLLTQSGFSIDDLIITLPNGKIRGRQDITLQNKTYYAFEKIPYATPPLGPLRFKAPQPAQNWEGILDTTRINVSCLQLQIDDQPQSEDCLYINVFTPQLPENETNKLLPVMFFIHGGAFIQGSSIDFGPDLFVNNDVLLVTINYRLGPFGFLSTSDDVIPGNHGLKDQKLAIQWAHDNIELFGGDPEKITIFGESAGSASVAYQLLNQNSEGLFQGAILQSGLFLCPWSFQRNPRKEAFGLATILNSTFETNTDSQVLLDYLQSVESVEILAAANKYMAQEATPWDYDVSQGLVWAPVTETKNPDAFITKKMYGLLQAGNILKVPILVGFNSEESLLFNPDPTVLQNTLKAWDDNLSLIVNNNMHIIDENKRLEMGKSIRDIYTGGQPFGSRFGDGIRYSSDTSFTKSTRKFAEFYSKLAKTYFYQFSRHGSMGKTDIHYDGAESVAHAEELGYLFCSGSNCNDSTYPESDKITRQRLIKIWTDFAKYQNPTPEPSQILQNITWPVVSTDDGDFFYVNINASLEIRNHPKDETYQQWIALYDSLNFTDFDTY
ncbi:venom carboxylesterase-6-like [Tribolium madens]|uniref:venom carboxylesterase-6-like n=1 Tax=Tribolium madens TaxID=41895 RepID=UPI001CF7421C|nr:venom carboxylesterase-6-like [Tribolium madens]